MPAGMGAPGGVPVSPPPTDPTAPTRDPEVPPDARPPGA
jgi:hypothetical protein